MKRKHFFTLLLLSFFTFYTNAQINLSVYSEISIVTAGPGEELYEAFGHSAIRIKDPVLNIDLIYNYGIFDFNQPNFYANFTKGKLLYQLGRYRFKYFLESYKRQNRWVKEQVLNLTQEQKQRYFLVLEENALPENKNYYYDPYFNNCSTKLRDITEDILAEKVSFKYPESGQTFRKLMNKEIPWNTWGSFGINFALGNILDSSILPKQYLYLPDYLYTTLKQSTLFSKNQVGNLVKKENILIDLPELQQKEPLFSPFLLFSVLCLLVILITCYDYKNNKRNKILDFSLFFITGLLGIVIVFLWFFTDHSTTPNNFNFLWSFAPNLIIAFLLLKSKVKKWVLNYVKILIILLIIIPVLWLLEVQLFPISIIPLLILLLIRYVYLTKYLSNNIT